MSARLALYHLHLLFSTSRKYTSNRHHFSFLSVNSNKRYMFSFLHSRRNHTFLHHTRQSLREHPAFSARSLSSPSRGFHRAQISRRNRLYVFPELLLVKPCERLRKAVWPHPTQPVSVWYSHFHSCCQCLVFLFLWKLIYDCFCYEQDLRYLFYFDKKKSNMIKKNVHLITCAAVLKFFHV